MGNKEVKNGHLYTELTRRELVELKAQTNFSEKEIRDWHVGFFHDCPNGELDRKKFIDIFKKFYVQDHRADSFCNYVFGMFDKDHSDTISFTEFLLAIASTTQDDTDKRLAVAFDMYDISGDGKLKQKELTNLILAMYDLVGETNRKGERAPKERAIQMMKNFDKDRDQKLSKAEFIDECKKDKRLIKMLAPKV